MGRPRSTHCHKGHELTDENVVYLGKSRHCRICRRAFEAAYRAKKRLENPPKKRTYTRKEKPPPPIPVRNDYYNLNPNDIVRFGRFFSASSPDKCWPWSGQVNSYGYGTFRVVRDKKRHVLMAHRVAYEILHGEIPLGFVIDHKCRNRRCVNPDHLEPVTNKENLMRGEGWGKPMPQPQAIKTHCPKGHPYDADNTGIYAAPDGGKHRRCRTCLREDARRRRDAKRNRCAG